MADFGLQPGGSYDRSIGIQKLKDRARMESADYSGDPGYISRSQMKEAQAIEARFHPANSQDYKQIHEDQD